MIIYNKFLVVTRNDICNNALTFLKDKGYTLNNTSIWHVKSSDDMLIAYFQDNICENDKINQIVTHNTYYYNTSTLSQKTILYTFKIYSQSKNMKITDFNSNLVYNYNHNKDGVFSQLSEFLKKKITEMTTLWISGAILKEHADYLHKYGLISNKTDLKGIIHPSLNSASTGTPRNQSASFCSLANNYSNNTNLTGNNLTSNSLTSNSITSNSVTSNNLTSNNLTSNNLTSNTNEMNMIESKKAYEIEFMDNRLSNDKLVDELQLYLGDWRSASQSNLCGPNNFYNIKLIVNCALSEHMPNFFEKDSVNYVQLNLNTLYHNDILIRLNEIFTKIKQYLDVNQGVLIHGVKGENFSAMIAILYLTLTLGVKYNVNLETVYIAIKNKRPCINVELKYLQFASSYLSKNGLDMLSSKEKLF